MKKFDVICFDVDSTLVQCEGVDWLADQKGVGGEVRHLTELAMSGDLPMEEVFSKKIDILKPSKKELGILGEYYCSQLVEKAEEVVDSLMSADIDVWLVTGGLLPAILPLANTLRISQENIHANEVYFDLTGNYLGINHNCTLVKTNGKADCVKKIGNNRRVAFVGDSVTDLATKPNVTSFIGYGGVKARQKVKDESEFFIKSQSLEPLLWLVLD
jgi:phosphoserine phosphatase